MNTDEDAGPELDEVFAAEVSCGTFPTIADARANLALSIERADADIDAGRGVDGDLVFTRLRERYANWPRAAE